MHRDHTSAGPRSVRVDVHTVAATQQCVRIEGGRRYWERRRLQASNVRHYPCWQALNESPTHVCAVTNLP